MWRTASPINPLTWVVFQGTYLVYSVAGAISLTAIVVTFIGTAFYLFDLFPTARLIKSGDAATHLMHAEIFIVFAMVCMVSAGWNLITASLYSTDNGYAEIGGLVQTVSFWLLFTFVLFLIADWCTLKAHRTRNAADPNSQGVKHDIEYARDSIWFIDVPVIIAACVALALEHFVTGNVHLSMPVHGGHQSRAEIEIAKQGLVLGLSLGGMALHVMMSQVIFFFLNFRYGLHKRELAEADSRPPAEPDSQPPAEPDRQQADNRT